MRFLSIVALGLGLALGAGLAYAFYAYEGVRLITMFLLGAFLFGSTVLLTALLVNRQWTRAAAEQRTTHNHRYQLGQPPTSSQSQPANHLTTEHLLPPPPDVIDWPAGRMQDVDEEVVG